MKKLIAFIFTAAVLIAAAIGLIACNPPHVHSYGEWVVSEEATCTHAGLRYRECECGVKDSETLPILPHTPVTVEGKAASCTEDGYTERVYCEVCETELTASKPLARLGHSFGDYEHVEYGGKHYHTRMCERDGCGELEGEDIIVDGVAVGKGEECSLSVNEVAATCFADAYTSTSCSVCGYEGTVTHESTKRAHKLSAPQFDPKTHKHTCVCEYEDCDYTVTDDCSFDSVTVEPSCLEDGYTRYTCSECMGQYEEVKPAPGHSYEEWVDDEKATCTAQGKQHRNCKNCETVEYKTIMPLGHDWEKDWTCSPEEYAHSRKCLRSECGVVDTRPCEGEVKLTPATCTTDGYKEYTCIECGHAYKEMTASATGHDYSGAYFEEIVKTDDGQSGSDLVAAHKHTHYQLCRHCGEKKSEDCTLREDSVSEATCLRRPVKTEVCDKCGSKHETYVGNALEHQWGEYQNGGTNDYPYHYKQCKVCHFYDYSVHCSFERIAVQPTCEEEGYTAYQCTVCKFVWKKSGVTPALGHDLGAYEYTGDMQTHTHQRRCMRDDCDYEEPASNCEMVPFEKAATCTAAGGEGFTCKYCKVNITQNTFTQLDHKWSLTTNKNDDTHERECINCHTVEQIAHSFDEQIIPADCENPGKKVKTCHECRYKIEEEIEDQLSKGHTWKPWEISADKHKSECTTCHKIEEAAHDFSESNICSKCRYDGVNYVLQGDHYIVKKNAALSATKNVVIKPYHSSLEEPFLVHPVTEISDSAFQNMPKLETVELPYTLQKIDRWAFAYCPSLRMVYINEEADPNDPFGEAFAASPMTAALRTIAEYAFMNDKALESFEAPEALTEIGVMAFADCLALHDITLTDAVTDIGSSAFRNTAYIKDENNWDHDGLYVGHHLIYAGHKYDDDGNVINKSIVVREGTLTIGANAFESCGLLEEVELPKTLKTVDSNAFIGCTSLVRVVFDGDMKEWFAINFVNDYSSPLHYATEFHINEDMDRVEIPAGVTRIPAGTFRNTAIKEVVIPEGVTYIGANAFTGCSQLASISVDDSVVYIGKDAFKDTAYFLDEHNWTAEGALYVDNHLIATDSAKMRGHYELKATTVTIGIEAFLDCAELESLVIPATVKRIGVDAFKGCDALKAVTMQGTESFFATSKTLNLSRVLDRERSFASPTNACENLKRYNGEWVWYKLYGLF